MTTTTLIFDFDGTLVDSGPGILHTFALVLQAHGLPPLVPLTPDLIGPPLPLTLRKLVGDVSPDQLETLAADFRRIYDKDGVAMTAVYPGVPAVITQLAAAGRGLHLATNKREKPTLLLLDQLGLAPHFKSVYCLDSRSPGFANKGAMLQALVIEQALTLDACIYIGDTSHDEAAAASAKLPFVAVEWGYGVGAQQVSPGARRIANAVELLTLTVP